LYHFNCNFVGIYFSKIRECWVLRIFVTCKCVPLAYYSCLNVRIVCRNGCKLWCVMSLERSANIWSCSLMTVLLPAKGCNSSHWTVPSLNWSSCCYSSPVPVAFNNFFWYQLGSIRNASWGGYNKIPFHGILCDMVFCNVYVKWNIPNPKWHETSLSSHDDN
jgi:hypothetical protein